MKTTKTTLYLLALSVSWIGAITVHAEDKTTETASQFRSIFIVPTSNKEGRDPFFPESTRWLPVAAPTKHAPEFTSLKVYGISGSPEHLLAIINNHTFAAGDEGDVLSDSGKIHLRCIEIQANAVIVEVNGQLHRINLETQTSPNVEIQQ